MSDMSFEIRYRDHLARIGQIDFGGKKYETPLLMPVINPNINLIKPRELMDTWGFESLITNSYIIKKNADIRERALKEGLHRMLDFPGLIMTDSGTFQSHIYGEVEVSNADIVSFERDIGADIGTILDIFTEPDFSREQVLSAMHRTQKRLEEAASLLGNEKMALAAPIQGGVYPDLRVKAAGDMRDTACDYHPIGGVVPLMENYRFRELTEIMLSVQSAVNTSRPLHLFGAGHPMLFPLAAACGMDAFDSALYAKYAKTGRMITPTGTIHLKNLDYLPCTCPVCSKYGSARELLELEPAEREMELARHNLWITRQELMNVKQAIKEGTLMELVEMRAHSHPALMEALKYLEDVLRSGSPGISNRMAFASTRIKYTGSLTNARPDILWFKHSVKNNLPATGKQVIALNFRGRPYREHYSDILSEDPPDDTVFIIRDPILGPVPLELGDVFPVSQMVHPAQDYLPANVLASSRTLVEDYLSDATAGAGKGKASSHNWDERTVRSIIDLFYGAGAFDDAFPGEITFKKSRKTGRIRNVFLDGQHIFSLDATTSFPKLKPLGAQMLLNSGANVPWVEVEEESSQYNREGKNVFSRFILASSDFRPYEDIAVLSGGTVVAVGKALMSSSEYPHFKRGIAIKVREGYSQKK